MVDSSSIPRHARLSLLISFVMTSALGCVFVSHVWLSRHLPVDAALRCATLMASLLAIHLVGFSELRWQARFPLAKLADRVWLNARRLRSNGSLSLAVCTQIFVWLLTSLLLDGGNVCKICGAAIVVYWSVIATGLLWRTRRMTWVDRQLVSYGFFGLLATITASWSAVLLLKGLR